MIKSRYKMLVNKVLLAILGLTFPLLVATAGRDDCDNHSSASVTFTPTPPVSLARSNSERYEDLPLKFLCKHWKLVRSSIILHSEDETACVMAGQCVSYNSNDPLRRTAIGPCPYIPHNVSWCHNTLVGFYGVSSSHSLAELTDMTCGVYNREGLLCSGCKPGYGPAVYAFSLMCVECRDDNLGWVLYLGLVTIFITIFYVIIVLLNIKATAPPFAGYVLMCQTYCIIDRMYVPMTMKMVTHSHLKILLHLVRMLCGVWNLDFFRHLIQPFCVSRHLNNLQALTLEYFYVVYPLVLITVTFVCIELHARNFKLIVVVWKPFHKLFVFSRRAWDPRASIINSFSTFLLLSVSKIIIVSSLYLYGSSFVYIGGNDSAYVGSVLYFSPSIFCYSKQHIPYLITSVVFLVMFTIVPSLLLCLYPTKIVRKLLHCCLLSRLRQGLWIFVETFQGYYEDGSTGQRDFRAISGAHFIILFLISSVCISDNVRVGLLPVVQLILVSVSLFYAIARPCKEPHANIIQSLLLALTAFILQLAYFVTIHIQTYFIRLVLLLCLLAPHIVLYGYAAYKIVKRIHRKFCCLISIPIGDDQAGMQHGRDCIVQQPDECTALLNDTY